MSNSKFGNTSELFNLYIEVGEIKLSSVKTEECRVIELWVGSCFRGKHQRAEYSKITRRPILSVLHDIEQLSEDKPSCVLIMEEEGCEAVHSWYEAVYLVIKYLHRLENIKAVVPFTKYTADEVVELSKRDNIYDFFADTRDTIYRIADAYVCAQPNIYFPTHQRKLIINNPNCAGDISAVLA